MALRCGDIRRGVNIATEIDNKQLKRDCAEILDSKKVSLENFFTAKKAQKLKIENFLFNDFITI